LTALRDLLPSRRIVLTALSIATGLAALVLVMDVLVVPSLIALGEQVIGRDFGIELRLRAHFAYASWILLLVLLVCLYVRPVCDRRARLVFFVLGIEILVLLAIWALDRRALFASEASSLTSFSAVALVLTSLGAFANAFHSSFSQSGNWLARAFWTLVGIAFLCAALDEYFEGHERIARALESTAIRVGLTGEIVQDLVTILYAAGAVVFLAIFGTQFRKEMLRTGSISGWILLVGIAVYGLAVFNDSADAIVERVIPYADPAHFMNFFEEALEFTAANLFLASMCVAFMERSEPGIRDWTGRTPANGRRMLRLSSLVLIAGTLLVSGGLAVGVRPVAPGIIGPGNYELSVFADLTNGLDEVDQLLFKPGLGLLVGNERSSNILRIDSTGSAQVLVHSKTGLVAPDGLAAGDASLFVADDKGRQVLEYSWDGILVGRVGDRWASPEGVVLDGRGGLYVADQTLRMIVRIGSGGKEIIASALDGLVSPEQLTIDEHGNLYVTDESARAVFRITPDRRVEKFVTSEQGLQCPEAIVFHRSHLYLTDSCQVAIFRFGLDGVGGPFIRFTRKYRDLAGIAFDDDGTLYVAVGSKYRPHNLILQIRGIE
jgi:sugar lactone lactonase YvrE